MKLSYSDLISPTPYKTNIGSIKSPTLREIWELGYNTYQLYLNVLIMTPQTYCTNINPNLNDWFNNLSHEENLKMTLFDLCLYDDNLTMLFQQIYNFFFVENVIWDDTYKMFMIQKDVNDTNSIIGVINSDTWENINDIICQLNNVDIKENTSEIKSKKAKSIMEKILRGRKKMSEKKTNKNYALDNIVSSVANRHPSLNMLNIWDLTVSQFWDAFKRTLNNNIYDLSSTSVSVWGDENHQFDSEGWFSRIENDN